MRHATYIRDSERISMLFKSKLLFRTKFFVVLDENVDWAEETVEISDDYYGQLSLDLHTKAAEKTKAVKVAPKKTK